VGFLMVCSGAIVTLQLAKQQVATKAERAVLLMTQLLLLSIFYTNIIFNHTASSFVWLIFIAVLSGVKSHYYPQTVYSDSIKRGLSIKNTGYRILEAVKAKRLQSNA
jgi:uncharacterized membrane protein HdeD (DUF308 family)